MAGVGSEPVSKLQHETAAGLGNHVLQVKSRRWIRVRFIQQVVNTGGNLKVFHEVLAEEGEVENTKVVGLRPLHRQRLIVCVLGIVEGKPTACVLEFQTGKEFLPNDGCSQV